MTLWRLSPALAALLLLAALAPPPAAAFSEKDIFIIKPGAHTTSGNTVIHYDQCYPLDGNRCERHDVFTVPRACVPYATPRGDEIGVWYCDAEGWKEQRVPAYVDGLPGVDANSGNVYASCRYGPSTLTYMREGCSGVILNVHDLTRDVPGTVVRTVTGLVTGVGHRVVSDGEGGLGVEVFLCGSLWCGPIVLIAYADPETGGVPTVTNNPCGWTVGFAAAGPTGSANGCADVDPVPTWPTLPAPTLTPPTVSGGGVTPPAGATGASLCNGGDGASATVYGWGATACVLTGSGTGGETLNVDLSPCPTGADPRVDVLGFWFVICLNAATHTGGTPTATPPTVTPGGLTVPPWSPESPDIDTSATCPTGASDPSVTWYGMRVAACGGAEPGSGTPDFVPCSTGSGARVELPGYGLYGACADA